MTLLKQISTVYFPVRPTYSSKVYIRRLQGPTGKKYIAMY